MSEIIDLRVERAFRSSGIKDKSLLKDIIDQGYDPNDPLDLHNYYEWKKFESVIYTDVEHNWTDEAIHRLYTDIKLLDDDQPYTITVDGVEFENDIFLKLDTNKKDE